MISLALGDSAFESEHLTTVESLFDVRIPDGLEYLPFQWKKEWLNRPIFRSSNNDLSRPMSYRALHEYMRDHSLEMGYPDAIGPKDWRRNAANTANRTTTGPERDLIMRHNEGSGTFRHSYLNQTVEHDMIAAVLNEVSQASLLQKLSHTGHARDRRAKRDMVPPDVWVALKQKGEAPDICELMQKRDLLRAEAGALKAEEEKDQELVVRRKTELGKEADRLTRRINSRRATEKKRVITRYHDFYFKTAPTCDVNRQLNGDAPLQHTPPVIECQLPERDELARLLSDQQPGKLDSKQLRALRIDVCCLYVRFGRLREPARPRIKQFLAGLAAPSPAEPKSSSPSPVPSSSSSSFSSQHHSLPSPLSPPSSSWSSRSPSPVTSASSWASDTYTHDSGVSSSPALSDSSYYSQQRHVLSNDSHSYFQYQVPPPVATYSGILAPVTSHVLPRLAIPYHR